MKEFKHTPGPWEASFTDCLGGPASYCRIRPVSGEMFGRFTSQEIATMYMMDEAEQQANARLIAAAPDLLDACRQFSRALESEDKYEIGNAYKSAWLAIAKATGATK